MAGRSMVVPGADYSKMRTGLPKELIPKIAGINAIFAAAKYDYASGVVTNPVSLTSAGDCVVMNTYNKPLKATNAPFTSKPCFGYTVSLETRKVSTAPIKFTENKWTIAIVYGNNNMLTMTDQRTILSLLNSANTEALVFQPTCAAGVFRVLQHEGTITPLSSVTGTPTSHETTFSHAFNTKGIVFVSYDGTNLRIYNGATLNKTIATAISFKEGTLWLGTDVRQSNMLSEMKGWIGTINTYDRVLSDAEIADLYIALNLAY